MAPAARSLLVVGLEAAAASLNLTALTDMAHACDDPQQPVRRADWMPALGGVAGKRPLRAAGAAARWRRALLVLALGASFADGADAQVPDGASALRAAFVYGFTKFTEWPEAVLGRGEPLVVCVSGSDSIHRALVEATRGRLAGGHPVVVRKSEPAAAAAPCHVLYVDAVDSGAALRVIEQTRGDPVLSVSDVDRFAQLGGIVSLFVEDGRIRFAINVEAARRSNLRLSSKLLSLGTIVNQPGPGAGDPGAVASPPH